MHKQTLCFIRRESIDRIDALVVVAVETKLPMSPAGAMDNIKLGFTAWVQETQDGADLWERSSQDMNIGDILCAADEKSYLPFLQRFGILKFDIVYSFGDGEEFSYDKVLVNE